MRQPVSVDYVIYSPKTPGELGAVLAECRGLLDDWLVAHDGVDEPFADFDLGGMIPSADAATQMVWDEAGDLASEDSPEVAEVLSRLTTIRSVITIERPDDPAVNPLVVSVLRFLIRGVGEGLVQLVDSLQTTELTLASIADKAEAEGFLPSRTATVRTPRSGTRAVTVDTTPRVNVAAIDVPRLIVDRLVADELVALDTGKRRDSLEKALDRALAADDVLSPVKALIEVLLDHDGVAEVFGTDQELEASMRRALESVAGR
jgi:hypothetical protein